VNRFACFFLGRQCGVTKVGSTMADEVIAL